MDIKFMEIAIFYANKALSLGEVPVGAVIVKDNTIIGSGYNLKETKKNSLMHAEIIAIGKACESLSDWRLNDCDIYVTLEPCPMCAGAILSSRIKNLYFGAYDYRFGACGTNDNLFYNNREMGSINVFGGIMEETCKKLLNEFFKEKRFK